MTRQQMIGKNVAGVDVAKNTLDLHIDPVGVELHAENSPEGRAKIIDLLKKNEVIIVVVEATGKLHRSLSVDLLDAGINVAVVNPQRTRHFALSDARPEKTDRIDAAVIARFARAHDQLLLQKTPEKMRQLADLVSRRRALIQMRVAEKNRLADELPTLAKTQVNQLLRLVEKQINDLDHAINKLIDSDKDWREKSDIIDSVPGVGPDTANQLVVQLPELGTISRTQIAKLAGVAPLCNQSGPRDGKRSIHGGRADARTTLYMAAFNAMLHNDRFKLFAARLRAAHKPFKVIVTAAMRKLLTILNQMVKNRVKWEPKLALSIS